MIRDHQALPIHINTTFLNKTPTNINTEEENNEEDEMVRDATIIDAEKFNIR